MTATETQVETTTTKRNARKRHIVELDKDGKPTDKCLCGYLWDRVFVTHDPAAGVCEECLEEHRRRHP